MPNNPVNVSRRQFLQQSLVTAAFPLLSYPDYLLADPSIPPPNAQVQFLVRSDAAFAQHRQIFNKRITVQPKVIAVCTSETGVQQAINYARAAKLPVAIKSGGHSFEGFSTNNGGLMLDLSAMQHKSYQAATKHLLIQPGAKLGQVYTYLNQYHRLIPAGSCAGVGVAGLTLGGGYGFFARQLGLTCDSLQRVRLVDGQGRIHDSKEDAELLWACKGGGNGNFGVVTELEFITHPTPAFFTSYRYKYAALTAEKATNLAKRWFNLMPDLPLSAYSSWVINGKNLTILITDTANAPSSALKTILTALKTGASQVMPVRKDSFLTGIQRYKGGTSPIYFKNVSAGYYHSFNDLQAVLPTILAKIATAKLTTLLQINTLGGVIANSQLETSAAYPHRSFSFLGELQTYYDQASQGQTAIKIVRDIQTLLRDIGIKAHYRNYPDSELPHWETAYYGNNYARLQALKHKLDPDDLIHHPQSVRL